MNLISSSLLGMSIIYISILCSLIDVLRHMPVAKTDNCKC